MGLVALLPGLAAARPPPDSKTFESLCAIHAPATGPHDISKDEYGEDEYLCGSWSAYMGAAAIGSRAYLAPYVADNVGVVDVSSSTFSTISTLDAGVADDFKYLSACAIGTTVYFAPFDEDNVGVLDTVSSAFSTVRLDGVNRGEHNYADTVAVGTTVYMSPWNQGGVGVLETKTSVFSTIDVPTAGGAVNRYWGAAAVGANVYFAPYYSRLGILVLDTTTSALTTISTAADGRTYRGYASALVLGTKVYFAPRCESNIGVIDTTSSTFSIIDISQRWSGTGRLCKPVAPPDPFEGWYEGQLEIQLGRRNWTVDNETLEGTAQIIPGPPSISMAAVGTKVYVVPDGRREVGVLDTVGNVFSTINSTTTEQAYTGAVAVGAKVVFAPACIDDTAGVLQTDSTSPPATGSSPTPDCSGAAASAASPLSLPHGAPSPPLRPHPAPPQALRPTMLQIALLSAGCFLCTCTVFGVLSHHAARRAANLRRSRDRAQGDLQLLTHQARPHSWDSHATPPVSLPPAPPSTSAGGSAAGGAAVPGAAVGLEADNMCMCSHSWIGTLMCNTELEQVLDNEMPDLAQQYQQGRSAPSLDACADEDEALLAGAQHDKQPQTKRQRQTLLSTPARQTSDEAYGAGVPQGCSSSGPAAAAPTASIEDHSTACSTSASRVLAAAQGLRASVSAALDARSSASKPRESELGRVSSTTAGPATADSTLADARGADGPAEQGGEETRSAQPEPTSKPEAEPSASVRSSRLRACTKCRRAKVRCVDGQRPCARCIRMGLPCDDEDKPVKAAACSNCNRSKVRCDLDSETDACSRCRRLGLVCEPVGCKRRGKKRRSTRGGEDDGDATESV